MSTDKVKSAESTASGASKAATEKLQALSRKPETEEDAKRKKEILRRQALMALIAVTWLIFLGSLLCVILVLSRFSSESKAYVFPNILQTSPTVGIIYSSLLVHYLFICLYLFTQNTTAS
ncbi:hypothetical protein ANCCAN_05578 [Ancylostoma caninum]|uniref:Uncharacterized protein n=1 Tax=Ancylostoma caninum TaxID=29170 RepID=A0A368GY58_ANCCA|nr:hypothetical protein ANCCAN_05578 [Ancylostoma caninum]